MRVDEKRVIAKIIQLSKSISAHNEVGRTAEELYAHAVSCSNQIITICELLEFEKDDELSLMSPVHHAYRKTASTRACFFNTPDEEEALMFDKAKKEQCSDDE